MMVETQNQEQYSTVTIFMFLDYLKKPTNQKNYEIL